MSIVFYIGVILLVFSLISPFIFGRIFKRMTLAGKFWVMYIGTMLGLVMIFLGAIA